MATMPGPSRTAKPTSDIYTVLVAIALVAVIGTLSFAMYRCNELLGHAFPTFAG